MDKLAPGKQDMISSSGSILINLSSWYRQSLAPKIHLIQEAIETCRLMKMRRTVPSLSVFW